MTPEAAFAALGLLPGASPPEVQAAFRKCAPYAHPDTGGTAAQFGALRAARDMALAYAATEPCPVCQGSGRAYNTGRTWGVLVSPCPACAGSGLRHN